MRLQGDFQPAQNPEKMNEAVKNAFLKFNKLSTLVKNENGVISNKINFKNDSILIQYVTKKKVKENNITRPITIKWFGGEPTLEMEMIKKLSDKLITIANKYQIPYSAYIQTNAYLLTQEIIDVLQDKEVKTRIKNSTGKRNF